MMEIQKIENDVLRSCARPQDKQRPATCYGAYGSMIADSKTDLRKSLQLEQLTWKLAAVGSAKYEPDRRMSIPLDKQLKVMSVMKETKPHVTENQTAMIACWNSVHGKPDVDKGHGSHKEVEPGVQVVKKPLGRTASDEIRLALKQKHAQSMERALRRNSGVQISSTTRNKTTTRSMSMIVTSFNTSNQNISRSISAYAPTGSSSSSLNDDLTNPGKVKDDRTHQKHVDGTENKDVLKTNKFYDVNSNEKPQFIKNSVNVSDEALTVRQISYPGAYQRLAADDSKRLSAPLPGKVQFSIEPSDDATVEVIQQMYKRNVYLRNEFNFWSVHGIMNTSGLLQSECEALQS